MRHACDSIGLMSGAKPAFLAGQLRHSLRMFSEVYAKWISSRDDRAELAQPDAAVNKWPRKWPQDHPDGTMKNR